MDLEITLSKVLPLLIYPLNLSLWLLIFTVLSFWRGRRTLAGLSACISLTVLWVCSTPLFAELLTSKLERQHLPIAVEQSPVGDAIVVLGGGLGLATPPRLAPDLDSSSDRVWHAAQLYRAGKAPIVIASGGNVFPQKVGEPESVYTSEILQQWGVQKSAILLESASRNTYENALETKKLIETHGLNKVLLVTSALHMPRALATFRSAGIDAIASPTDFRVTQYERPLILKWLPTTGSLSATTSALKEFLGIAVYRWRGWVKSV
ncbi:MAG: YdcF family protein [Gammaproteobacteria bacterium]|nr:YdcF family protein [Gammaproteobacteria bacterium]